MLLLLQGYGEAAVLVVGYGDRIRADVRQDVEAWERLAIGADVRMSAISDTRIPVKADTRQNIEV